MRLVNIFMNNKEIPLHELHLAGNALGSNQIIYLINQLHLDSLRKSLSTQDDDVFIFPYLRILDLNGRSIFFSNSQIILLEMME